MSVRAVGLLGVAHLALTAGIAEAASPIKRTPPLSGRIIARKAGETAVLTPSPTVYPAEVRQDLKEGDVLRTNAVGTLAIVFADGTQIRLGRNSVLLVKHVQAGSPSTLQLQRGGLWARSPRGQTNLSVETPAANAAVRGTSWSLNVTDSETTLQVFEGKIEFANPQGELTVGGGEAARARIGEAPTRLAIVNSSERAQMAYYLRFHDASRYLRPFAGSFVEQRAARSRILAIAPSARSAEDWLTLAEAGAELDANAERLAALQQAEVLDLSTEQRGRAQLVRGMMAIERGDWDGASQALAKAAPGLSAPLRERASSALLLARLAAGSEQALAEAESPANDNSAGALAATAFREAFQGDLQRGLELAEQGERLYPQDAEFVWLKGSIGLLIGDRDLLVATARRGMELDPEHPGLLMLSAVVKANYLADLDGAAADAQRATQIAPGNSLAWNVLGLIEAERRSGAAAEPVFRSGVTANPGDPVVRAHRAMALLDQNRLKEARRELDAAVAIDPQQSIVQTYRGRASIQKGDMQQALDELLEASAGNPTHAQTLLLLAYVYHRLGKYESAEQQLELAERYDPNGPLPAIFRSAMARDRFKAGEAITAARAAIERAEKLNGSDDREPPTHPSRFMSDALRQQSLDDWARDYSDRAADPFVSESYFQQARNNRPNPYFVEQGLLDDFGIEILPPEPSPSPDPCNEIPDSCPPPGVPPGANPLGGVQFVSAAPETLQDQLGITPYDAEAAPDDRDLSNIMRGIALDPLATSGMRKHLNLFRQQFFEASATATAIAANDGIRDGESARVEGLSLDGTPLAYQLSGGRMRYSGPLGDKDEQKLETVQGSLGVELSPALNLAVMASHWRRTDKFQNLIDETYGVPPVQIWKVNNRQSVSERSNSLYLLAAHQFTDRATLMAGGGYLETRLAMDRHETTSLTYLDLGFEFVGDFKFDRVVQSKTIFGTAAAQVELGPWVVTAGGDYERRTGSRKLMIDDIEPQMDHGRGETDRFFLSTSGRPLDPLQIDGFIALRDGQVEGGAGLRLEVSERQSFAAAYSSEIVTSLPFSLGPMTLAGLVPNSAPAAIGTRSKSIMGRWAAEWSNWLFTSVDVQHQNHDFLLAPAVRAFQSPTAAIDVTLRPPWVEVGARDIDRATITSNILLSRTLAIDVVGAIARSDNHAFLAKKYGKAEARWTSPIGVRASLAVTFLGKRVQHDGAFDLPLDKALWTDFTLNWRSPGRCWEVDLRLYNITNSNIDMYENYPRFRRTIALSLTTRL